MNDEAYWVLNRNEGIDTVHRNPREACNTDDAEGRETIDALTAARLLQDNKARPCQHCLARQE